MNSSGAFVEWRCFHCDEVFTDWGAARNHFGYTPADGAPACRVEGGVASELYHMRRRLDLYQQEDTELHRRIAALQAEHATALRRAEEDGYARGLRDAGLSDENAMEAADRLRRYREFREAEGVAAAVKRAMSVEARVDTYRNGVSVRCARMADTLFASSGRDLPTSSEVAEEAGRLLMEVCRAIDTWATPMVGEKANGH